MRGFGNVLSLTSHCKIRVETGMFPFHSTDKRGILLGHLYTVKFSRNLDTRAGGERTDTGLLLCMSLLWFWSSSRALFGVPRDFCPFMVPSTSPHAVFRAPRVLDLCLGAPNPSGSLDLLVCFCSSPACWRNKKKISTAVCSSAPALLLQVVLSAPRAPPFPSLCFPGVLCAFWVTLNLLVPSL